MMIWGHPELDHNTEIQANGKGTFPLVGEITMANRTAEEVRIDILQQLGNLATPQDPHLRFGDVVTLFVWRHPDLAFSATVQPDGSINLPLVGTLNVTDKTLSKLNKETVKRLSALIKQPKAWLIPEVKSRKIISDPIVSILPTKLSFRKITVIGELAIEGQQPLTTGMRVFDALANAQPTDNGSMDNVIIIRESDTETPSYRRLKLASFLTGDAPRENIYLQEGDVIIIPKTGIAHVAHFVDMFFSRTKPIFDWYNAGYQASKAVTNQELNEEVSNTIREVNQSFLNSQTVTPVQSP
jgi:polysaccharide export outer membrane protein